MRTLTAPATLATGRTYTAPILLVTMTTVSGTVFKLSDYNRVLEGVEYAGLIQNPNDLTEALNDFDGGGSPATARLVLFNDLPVGGKARFSDLIQTPRNLIGTYDFSNARVDIDRLEQGQALADAVRLQSFYLETPSEIGDALVTLQMSDLALKIEDALPITKISRALFTSAQPGAIGQTIRRPFGTLKNVKAIPVQDGAAGSLNGDLTDVATSIILADASSFPTSGTGLIEQEFITWVGRTTTTLLNVVRGVYSTLAVAHASGAGVLETRTDQYVFVVGEGFSIAGYGPVLITAVTNVRVNGHVARTAPTITANDTALIPNRGFATIRFTPSNVALFHLLPQGEAEKLTVTALSVTGDGATHLQAVRTITPTAGVAEVTTRTRRTISWTITTPTAFTDTNDWTLIRRPPGVTGTTAYDVIIGQGQGAAGNTTGNTWSGTDTRDYPTEGAESILFQALLGSAKVITCTFNDVAIVHPDAAGGGSPSAASACIGEVICDVLGFQDLSNGLISGTPFGLLENPADIMTAILLGLYGLTTADLDATWPTTRELMHDAGYKWAVLLDAISFSDLRRRWSEQARARLVMTSGKVALRFRAYRPSADVTFQYDPVGGRTGLAQDLTVKITSPTELIPGLTVRYAYDDARGDFQKSLTVGDATAAGVLPAMDLSFITDETTARGMAEYWFGLKRRQRFTVDGTAWHNALALEQGDYFAITGVPALVAHGDQNLIFALLRKADRGSESGLGQIALGGTEATIEGDVGPEDTSLMWGSRGLLAKNNAATPTTKIDVTAAAIVLRNSANLIVIRHNPGSLTVDLTAAGPVANGRDQAGAHTASSWIHLYWIWDATNGVLALISSAVAPPTGPTFPTNFTYWSYVGAFYFSAGSALIRTTISGSWASRQNVEALAAAVTDNTEHSIDGTAIWPPNAMRIGGCWMAVFNAASDSADLRPESGVDAGLHLEATALTNGGGGPFTLNVTGQTLWYIQSANASRVWRVEISEYQLPNGG